MEEEVTADLKAERGGREEGNNRGFHTEETTQSGFHLKIRSFLPWVNFEADYFIVLEKKTQNTPKDLLLCRYRTQTLFWNDRSESLALRCSTPLHSNGK